ncbi:hypothetical protein HWV62_25932 [Athelia sp. TMB]|nr:hypothetical protein HWV62_25932 [Athelia sp. TMB]
MSTKQTCAEDPFGDPDGDVILRSCDGIDFRLQTVILVTKSPIFNALFDLPQDHAVGRRNGIPFFCVAEPASVLRHLLQSCYPLHIPGRTTINNIHEILELLVAADKYDLSGVDTVARFAIAESTLMFSHPFDIYVIATQCGWEAEASSAARRTFAIGSSLEAPYSQIIQPIPRDDRDRLRIDFSTCVEAAIEAMETLVWPHFCSNLTGCHGCKSISVTVVMVQSPFTSATRRPDSFWEYYLRDVQESLKKRPCGSTALDKNIIDQALRRRTECSICCKKSGEAAADEHLRAMGKWLQAQIDRNISEIQLMSERAVPGFKRRKLLMIHPNTARGV